MRKNPWVMLGVLVLVFGALFSFLVGTSVISLFGRDANPIKVSSKKSILKLELNGIIFESEKFLKQLKKYRENDNIKAIVIEINSPGGVVGPSQEIYEEIVRTRDEFLKPVVAVSISVMASGAYYAAVATDKIVVAPGTMMGSIGVIMEFMNLEKLYDWAKVSRYSINTGKYKDSGAEYRSMRPDEKALFQELVDDVHLQFKTAVADGRKLKMEYVADYADGRVFTGAQGVKLGFADEEGTVDDALDIAADLAGLDDYEVFEPPKRRPHFFEVLTGAKDEEDYALAPNNIKAAMDKILKTELLNKPLFLMPGSF